MTSAINPSNINGNYPIAGQDNSSQPMRDNFTNTKLNFQIAADEITQLQNNAILKAPLNDGTLNNDMMGALISNAQIQGFTETSINLGNRAGSVAIDFLASSFQTVSTTGPISLQFTNWPKAGVAAEVTVAINVSNVAHTVTFPSVVIINNKGIVGLNTTTNTLTVPVVGVYAFRFVTNNGGYSLSIESQNTILEPLNASSENLFPDSEANIAATTSYFSVGSTSAAVLPPGVEGSTKILAFYGNTGGDMTITVNNPGWSSAINGFILFTAIGQACTMRYIKGKWFCIGNNGCTFS